LADRRHSYERGECGPMKIYLSQAPHPRKQVRSRWYEYIRKNPEQNYLVIFETYENAKVTGYKMLESCTDKNHEENLVNILQIFL